MLKEVYCNEDQYQIVVFIQLNILQISNLISRQLKYGPELPSC
jgi:hypothetical protein